MPVRVGHILPVGVMQMYFLFATPPKCKAAVFPLKNDPPAHVHSQRRVVRRVVAIFERQWTKRCEVQHVAEQSRRRVWPERLAADQGGVVVVSPQSQIFLLGLLRRLLDCFPRRVYARTQSWNQLCHEAAADTALTRTVCNARERAAFVKNDHGRLCPTCQADAYEQQPQHAVSATPCMVTKPDYPEPVTKDQVSLVSFVWYIRFIALARPCDQQRYSILPAFPKQPSTRLLTQWFSIFHGLWPPSKDCQHLWPPPHHYCFAISRQSYVVKASARGHRRTAPWTPRGEKPLFN